MKLSLKVARQRLEPNITENSVFRFPYFFFHPVEGRQRSVSFISLLLILGVGLLVISVSKWETDEDTCKERNFKTASRGFLW